MAKPYRVPRRRYLRYSEFDRIKRQEKLPRFLAKESTDLNATAAAVTVTPTARVAGVRATQALTFTNNAANTQTVTIGSTVYTFRTVLTSAANDVLVGANTAASIDNLVAAINREHGRAGVVFSNATQAHPSVTAVKTSATVLTITAKAEGTAANAIATTETLANASWGAATMAGGVAAVDATLTAAAHGLQTAAGPFRYTAATTHPTGVNATALYWAIRDSANTFGLALSPEDARKGKRVQFSSVGAGAQSVARGTTSQSLFERIRSGRDPRRIASSTDIDNL